MNGTDVKILITFLFLLIAVLPLRAQEGDGVYSFTMKTIDGAETSLGEYRGEVLLIVNTASKCGYTKQYASLEELYRRYADRGLRILAFPANNFGGQEPGSNAEIKEFCQTTFDVSFDLFAKISVDGEDRHPLYDFLTSQPGAEGEIKWNFTKFLVDREGNVTERFNTRVDPLDENVISAIEHALGE